MRKRDVVLDLSRTFTVEMLMTPRDDLLCWQQGTTPESAVAEADQKGYSRVPVEDSEERIIGIVETEHLKVRKPHQVEWQPLAISWLLSADTSIRRLIEVLSYKDVPVYFVLSQDRIVGLVTAADLNKSVSRTYLYLLLSQLERQLARLVQKHFEEPEEFVSLLGRERQAEIRQFLEQTQAGDVELDLTEYLYLSDLITIVEKTAGLRELLGWPSRNQAASSLGKLNELRNRVVHSVRLIIRSPEEVSTLQEWCHTLEEVLNRLLKVLS